MKVSMIASKDMVYAGRRIRAGTGFETTGESDARVLEAIGHAKRRPPEPPKAAVVVPQVEVTSRRTWHRTVEASPVSETLAKPKRQYRRKDETAEGSEG